MQGGSPPWVYFLPLVLVVAGACGDDQAVGDDDDDDEGGVTMVSSNRARFAFDCDLQGVTARLTMEVEAVASTGIVFGSGPRPDITAVIATGDVTYFTSGTVVSPVASYVFTGENNFADFTDQQTLDRFRVEWRPAEAGLIMVINPFGPAPARHDCALVEAMGL